MNDHVDFDPEGFLKIVPNLPGVYQMYDNAGTLLYVGKAKELKKRLTSYFRKNLSVKTAALVEKITKITFVLTGTENQALLLESRLVKHYRPRYNILLRDDKSFPYLAISQGLFPRLFLYRGKQKADHRYFGPYPSVDSLKKTLNVLQKIFKLRSCTDNFFKNRTRPCMQYQIHRCTAPCVQYINQKKYQADVRHAILFLQGKSKSVVRMIQKKMQEASKHLDFETAARCRDQINALRVVQAQPAINMEHLIIEEAKIDPNQFQTPYETLQTILNLEKPIERIECFDVSHTSGEATIASCVVFGKEGAQKSDYRKYNVIAVKAADDYAALKQVLTRRFALASLPDAKLPDVLLIDGGKGQLKQAKEVLEALNVRTITVLAISKGAGRKSGMERIFLLGAKFALDLDPTSPVFHLLQQIRDEAHRFAIMAHRQKRDKRRHISPLENIPGVGAKRRRALLKHFGGWQELKGASVEELAKIPGIQHALAKKVYLFLKEN